MRKGREDTQRQSAHCSRLLYQLTVEAKRFTATSMIALFSNLPGQYLKAGAGIRANSRDYEPEKMLPCERKQHH